MEVSEFLEKINKSKYFKELRARKLKISQNTIDEVNEKYAEYGINLQKNEIEIYVNYVLSGVINNNVYRDYCREIIDKNEFEFSSIDEVKEFLEKYCIGCSNLISEESKEFLELLKEVVEVADVKNLNLQLISPEIINLSELTLDSLKLWYGSINSETVLKLPKVNKLEINSVELKSINDLKCLENLSSLCIYRHSDDSYVELSGLSNFKNLSDFKISNQVLSQESFEEICKAENLTNLDIELADVNLTSISNLENLTSLKISNQTLSQESFEKICQLKKLTNLEIELEEESVKELSSILNLSELEGGITGAIIGFISFPIIKNLEDFRKLMNTKHFKDGKVNKVTYIGKEKIPIDLLDGINHINLEILSPFVIGKEFASKFENGFPGRLEIKGDLYENYTAPEIYSISQNMKKIIDSIPKDASDFEKVARIYETIGKMCFYDYTGCKGDEQYIEGREMITRSLKGAFLENKLVCQGYAFAFKMLADEIGIESVIASGEALDIDEKTPLGKHAWNQVKIDGQWYNLDLTWDDENIRCSNELEWFLLSDKDFYKGHKCEDIGNTDIRAYMEDNKFDFTTYEKEKNKKNKPYVCNQSYDKQKIADYFKTKSKEFEHSNEIVSIIGYSEAITIPMIQNEMACMVAKENSKNIVDNEKKNEINI